MSYMGPLERRMVFTFGAQSFRVIAHPASAQSGRRVSIEKQVGVGEQGDPIWDRVDDVAVRGAVLGELAFRRTLPGDWVVPDENQDGGGAPAEREDTTDKLREMERHLRNARDTISKQSEDLQNAQAAAESWKRDMLEMERQRDEALGDPRAGSADTYYKELLTGSYAALENAQAAVESLKRDMLEMKRQRDKALEENGELKDRTSAFRQTWRQDLDEIRRQRDEARAAAANMLEMERQRDKALEENCELKAVVRSWEEVKRRDLEACAEARAEARRMRPVVEAARQWRPGRERQGIAAALCDAVDDYEEACDDEEASKVREARHEGVRVANCTVEEVAEPSAAARQGAITQAVQIADAMERIGFLGTTPGTRALLSAKIVRAILAEVADEVARRAPSRATAEGDVALAARVAELETILRDCPFGIHNGAVAGSRSMPVADVVAWISRVYAAIGR